MISEILKQHCKSEKTETLFSKKIKHDLQRNEIYYFLKELDDKELLYYHENFYDLVTIIQLSINSDWELLDEIVSMKAKLLKKALELKKQNLEVIKRQKRKKPSSQSIVGGIPIIAESVKEITFTGRKSGKNIKNTKEIQKKNKSK